MPLSGAASPSPPSRSGPPRPTGPPSGRGASLTGRQHASILLASLALVAVFTYPLARDPGHLLPVHKDPLMYAWTMASNVHRALGTPRALFHGNTFYPNGNSVAYTDLLVTPTLFPAAVVYLLTGNPVLQYNLTLLAWWALSGWAMYVLAFGLFRSHAAAAMAAAVFTLCPFRTDFFLEFQMELAFPIPLAFLCFWRFLENRRWRWILATVAWIWVEALASMYYAIILGLCLAAVGILALLLRPRTWGWQSLVRAGVALAVLGLALAPFLVPYAQNNRELHLERSRAQPRNQYADVMTYFETGVTRLYHFSPSGHLAETSLFMGFIPLALAAVAFMGAGRRQAGDGGHPLVRAIRWVLTAATTFTVVGLAARLAAEGLGPPGGHRWPPPQSFLDVLLILGVARIAFEGWWADRTGDGRSPLGDRELRWICLWLVALFFDLSLGSYVQYRRHELGHGLYFHLYPYLLPLHAMRVTSRIGVVVVLAVALLAGLGLRQLVARLPRRGLAAFATGLAVGLVLAEYAPMPLPYASVAWERPPPVYRALASEPDDVAVLEWPQGDEDWDDLYTFRSVSHWKRLTNGASGFLPALTWDLSSTLARPDDLSDPFPTPGARRYLLGIYPLRYVVVHNAALDEAERAKWRKLRSQPWAEYVARYGSDDLYRLSGDTAGGRIDKLFSWDLARTRREIAFEARGVGPPGRRHWIDVELNERSLGRVDVGEGWTPVRLPLAPISRRSAPSVLTIFWRYDRPPGGGPFLGATGTRLPVDLSVTSGGKLHGDLASILVDGIEYATNRRGYNVVTVDAVSRAIGWTDAFDTFASPEESERMAARLRQLAPGTIVAVAVKDEASGSLSEDAVAALRSIGAREDIRGRFRTSHLVVGVAGAAAGAAVERVGDARLDVDLGTPRGEAAVEVRNFRLE